MLKQQLQWHALVRVENEELRDEMCGHLADIFRHFVLASSDLAVSDVVLLVVEGGIAHEHCKAKVLCRV